MPNPRSEPLTEFADETPPAKRSSASKRSIVLALGTVYLVWGSTYLGIRIAIESIPPLLMAGTRFTLAGVLMIAFARWRQRAPWPTPRQWRDAFVVGACLLTVGNSGVTLAEGYIPSGLAATLVAVVPMFLLLFGWWAGISARPNPLTVFALVLGVFGVCLLMRPALATADVPALSAARLYTGSGIMLVASVVWAAGSLYAKRADRPASAVLSIGTQMLAGGAIVLPISALCGEWSHFHLASISSHSLWAFAYLVIVGSLVGFSAYVWLLVAARPTLVGTYAFVNPGVAVLLGWAVAGERIYPTMLAGMGIILVAVALSVLFPPPPMPAVPAAPLCPRPLPS